MPGSIGPPSVGLGISSFSSRGSVLDVKAIAWYDSTPLFETSRLSYVTIGRQVEKTRFALTTMKHRLLRAICCPNSVVTVTLPFG